MKSNTLVEDNVQLRWKETLAQEVHLFALWSLLLVVFCKNLIDYIHSKKGKGLTFLFTPGESSTSTENDNDWVKKP